MDDSAAFSRGSSPLNSSVLTSDTDNFIVGDRVWVHGTKPGYIQFIGETKFASGEWAGIVLDEPIGKNDGTIKGIHYFQCEPNRGIFARLYRLTRYPLGENGNRSVYFDDGIVKRTRSTTPTGRVRTTTTRIIQSPAKVPHYALPCRPSKVITEVVTTTSTTVDSNNNKLRIGDKVLVYSNDGPQTGRVRYLGRTSFARGEWVGVELDDPNGKNDGTIAGRRYFSCPKGYGLFASIHKVIKADPRTVTRTRIINPTNWKSTPVY